ncbi:hypothetical protein [Chitinimonas sp. BJYL2]|uniref:hypothetical protein n=1 Tax=Chitinimonas sp. BJYL2 TaxID=2976696 RepID=UPI0022B2B347|nr:hypothetical protein [Chitinimonas sp. BJYL2]
MHLQQLAFSKIRGLNYSTGTALVGFRTFTNFGFDAAGEKVIFARVIGKVTPVEGVDLIIALPHKGDWERIYGWVIAENGRIVIDKDAVVSDVSLAIFSLVASVFLIFYVSSAIAIIGATILIVQGAIRAEAAFQWHDANTELKKTSTRIKNEISNH